MRKLAGFLLAAALLALPGRAAEPIAAGGCTDCAIAADGRLDAWSVQWVERAVGCSLAHQEDGALWEPLSAENSRPEPSPKPAAPESSPAASLAAVAASAAALAWAGWRRNRRH